MSWTIQSAERMDSGVPESHKKSPAYSGVEVLAVMGMVPPKG